MKKNLILFSFAAAMTASGSAQEPAKPAESSPELAAVLASDRAYEEAYAKGDASALVASFTDDAEYTSDDGQTFSGKEAIETCLREAFRTNKGAKLSIDVASVKTIAPGVIAEKGTTTVVLKSGETAGSLYTAVQVKKDGKWKISQLVETPLPTSTPGEHLAELSWLIGGWTESDKEEGVTVNSRYQWANGGNFISRNITVKRGDNPVLEGWQIIGWNPVDERIRSWTFDDAGGFSEGTWARDGERWLVREIGYAADGGRTTSDSTISKVSADRVFWESNNRTLDGEPQPGIGRIEITKVKGE